jgi:hypothetical protein
VDRRRSVFDSAMTDPHALRAHMRAIRLPELGDPLAALLGVALVPERDVAIGENAGFVKDRVELVVRPEPAVGVEEKEAEAGRFDLLLRHLQHHPVELHRVCVIESALGPEDVMAVAQPLLPRPRDAGVDGVPAARIQHPVASGAVRRPERLDALAALARIRLIPHGHITLDQLRHVAHHIVSIHAGKLLGRPAETCGDTRRQSMTSKVKKERRRRRRLTSEVMAAGAHPC